MAWFGPTRARTKESRSSLFSNTAMVRAALKRRIWSRSRLGKLSRSPSSVTQKSLETANASGAVEQTASSTSTTVINHGPSPCVLIEIG
jgi:hypothetical protein